MLDVREEGREGGDVRDELRICTKRQEASCGEGGAMRRLRDARNRAL